MAKRSRKVLSLAMACMLVLGAFTFAPITASAVIAEPVAGDLSDGVDFSTTTGLLASGSGIYYGTYDHAVYDDDSQYAKYGIDLWAVGTIHEGADRPILWRVMGEEQAGGTGDGYITVMSEYVLDALPFKNPIGVGSSTYSDSDIQVFLAGSFMNSFFAAEKQTSAMVPVTVETKSYKPNEPALDTALYNSTVADQQAYLLWGAYEAPFATLVHDSIFWSANGTVSATETENVNNSIYRLADNTDTRTLGNAYFRSGGGPAYWWLRSPLSKSTSEVVLADRIALCVTNLGNINDGNQTARNHGIRPAFKLNPASVIFASEIVSSGGDGMGTIDADSLNYPAATVTDAKNYKLTVVGGSSGADVGLLTGVPTTPQQTTATGAPLVLSGLTASNTEAAYTINYKIVAAGTQRTIAGYGKTLASDTSLSIDTSGLTAGESYDVYVWLQKNNAINSNEGTAPTHFALTIPDTVAPSITDVQPTGAGAELSGRIVVTFSESMKTTVGTVSLDGGGTTLPGTWSTVTNANDTFTADYSGLGWNTRYTVTISGFQDVAGNVITPDPDISHTFTTKSSGSGGGGGGTSSPAQAVAINGVKVPAKQNADGSVTITPTKTDIDKVIAAARDGVYAFDFSGISGVTGVLLEVDPAWFDESGDHMLLTAASIGSVEISDAMMKKLALLEGKVVLILKRGSLVFDIQQDGKSIDWYSFEHPVTISMAVSSGSIMADKATGNVIPRSWYKDGMVYAKVYTTGTYEAKAATAQSFSDTSGLWMDEATSYMAARGIIAGVGDNQFAPGTNVTRGQFVTMLMRMVNIEPQGAWMVQQFGDAESGAYYYDALLRAKALGLVSGIGDNKFAPDAEITRQDLFVMLYRAMETLNMIEPSEGGMALQEYGDYSQIAQYAEDALLTFVQEGLVKGAGGNLSPTGTATRAEAAQVLYNVLVRDAK